MAESSEYRKSIFKGLMPVWQYSSVGRDACHHTWQPKFEPQNLHSRKKKLTLVSFPLSSTYKPWHTYDPVCVCLYINLKKCYIFSDRENHIYICIKLIQLLGEILWSFTSSPFPCFFNLLHLLLALPLPSPLAILPSISPLSPPFRLFLLPHVFLLSFPLTFFLTHMMQICEPLLVFSSLSSFGGLSAESILPRSLINLDTFYHLVFSWTGPHFRRGYFWGYLLSEKPGLWGLNWFKPSLVLKSWALTLSPNNQKKKKKFERIKRGKA